MRAVECPCGEYLEAKNDSELLEAAKRHASDEHGDRYSEADLRVLVDTSASDVGSESAP